MATQITGKDQAATHYVPRDGKPQFQFCLDSINWTKKPMSMSQSKQEKHPRATRTKGKPCEHKSCQNQITTIQQLQKRIVELEAMNTILERNIQSYEQKKCSPSLQTCITEGSHIVAESNELRLAATLTDNPGLADIVPAKEHTIEELKLSLKRKDDQFDALKAKYEQTTKRLQTHLNEKDAMIESLLKQLEHDDETSADDEVEHHQDRETKTTHFDSSSHIRPAANLKNLKCGFLGFGEIGSSLCRVYEMAGYHDLARRDPKKTLNDSFVDCDLVNVCIPFLDRDQFSNAIKSLNLKPKTYLVIQSTIPLGTCDELQRELDSIVIHSPVRGVHPHLTDGIFTFEKYVGISEKYQHDKEVRDFMQSHLLDLNIQPVWCRARESELAKIVSTTLYGVNIAAVNDVFLICEKFGIDFDVVFTKWQRGYNVGYTKLGKPNVCRPILYAIPRREKDGKQLQVIGGHCVIPNAMILKKMGFDAMADFVLRYSEQIQK